MINFTLLKRSIKDNYAWVLLFCGVLTMYSLIMITMYDPTLGESLKMMAESMPEFFEAFGMAGTATTLIEFLSVYPYGLLYIMFPLVGLIIIGNRLLARYTDRGSMAYLLATPNKRSKIAITQAFFLLKCAGIFVAFVTILDLVGAHFMFEGALDVKQFLWLNLGLLCLHIFFSGIIFFGSAIANDTKTSISIGAGIPVLFVLMQMISQAGDKFKWLANFNPMSLFNPTRIIAGETEAYAMFCILLVIGIALFINGVLIFSKRDIPV